MADLVIREIDDSLKRRLRSEAALEGKTLKDFLLPFLQMAVKAAQEKPAKSKR
jgi:plasmid stability protein